MHLSLLNMHNRYLFQKKIHGVRITMYGNEDSKDGKWRSDLYKSRRFGREGAKARDRELGIVKVRQDFLI